LSRAQKAGVQNHFRLQHAAQAQAAVHPGCEKGRVHRAQENQQGRMRKAVDGWWKNRAKVHPFSFEFIFDGSCPIS
jgi:hypothetical protein